MPTTEFERTFANCSPTKAACHRNATCGQQVWSGLRCISHRKRLMLKVMNAGRPTLRE